MANPEIPVQPAPTDRMPPGIPFIIGNEAAERFTFYGLRTILVVFMTQYLLDRSGTLAVMNPEEAKGWFHLFVSAAYFLPFFGAILSDAFWGKYRTILWLSIVYCVGSFALAANHTRLGLLVGLGLIAIGAGGIKPCVSANVGDQFGPRNQHLLPKAFSWFYFSINLGSFLSTMLTPFLLEPHSESVRAFLATQPGWGDALRTIDPNMILAFAETRWCPGIIPQHGARLAFGVPGVFMLLATLVFWLGRHRFTRVPPAGASFVRETFKRSNLLLILGLVPIFLAEAIFWSLWDQTGSAWVLQAEKMDLRFLFEWRASQVQAVNPLFILILIPVCTYGLYPLISRVFPMTPLRRIGLGLFLAVISFLITAWVELQIGRGLKPNISWQFLSFVVISLAEIMVSITCLEFAYTQAPGKLKSLVMSLNLMSISLGNAITSAINFFIQNPDGSSKLPGVTYFLFFAGLMLATAILFVFVARSYGVGPIYYAPARGRLTTTEVLLSLRGRLGRSDYWLRGMAVMLPFSLLGNLLYYTGQAPGVAIGLSVLSLWPAVALVVKRLHDQDRSGWVGLVFLVPFLGPLLLIVAVWFLKGTDGPNRFGPDPRETHRSSAS